MPKKSQETESSNTLPFVLTHKALSLTIIALIIFSVSGVAWWKHVYNSPRRVFEGMLKANLSTQSVTRATVSQDQGGPVEKTEQISFVPAMASRTVVTISQESADGVTNVVSETIGTTTRDYSRYIKIETPQKNAEGKALDYTSVINRWGESASPQAYQQATLGLIPFANLRQADLNAALASFDNKKVYDIDYAKVEPKRLDGKSALIFTVKINTAAYVEVLKDLSKKAGFSEFKDLNPADYKDSAPIEVKLTIDKLSRHLMVAEYVGSSQKETYSSYGLSAPITLPKMTMPIESLQQQIQEIK